MRKLAIAAFLAVSLAAAPSLVAQDAPPADAAAPRAGAYKLDKSHAKIIWSTSHLGFSTYYGEFTDFDAQLTLDPADPAKSKLNVTVNMKSVATHNDAMDKHLNNADFFDTGTHPTATFVSTAINRTGENTADVTGDFTLRGVTKPLTLKVTFNKAGEMRGNYVAGFSAEGTIKRSEHGMTFGVPAVGDDVKLLISGEFNPA